VIPKDWAQRFSIDNGDGRGGVRDADAVGMYSYDSRAHDTPPPLEHEFQGEMLVLKDDMIWDDCTEDNDTADPDAIEKVAIDKAFYDLPNVNIDGSIIRRIDKDAQDPIQCCLQIGKHVLSEMVTCICNKVNEKYLGKICLSTILGLMIQMRLSCVARKSALHLIQGSLTLILSTVAVGTLSTIELKRSLMGINTAECDGKDRNIVLPRRENAIDTLKNAFQLLQQQTQMDPRFRQRWQGFLAVIVLYYFRSQRQRIRIMKK